MPARYIAAQPYPWPYNGDLQPANTALLVIDMQTDFCGLVYVDRMGYDLSLTRAPIEPLQRVLARMRQHGFHILHTREAPRGSLISRPINAGAHARSAPGSVTLARVGISYAGTRVGHYPRARTSTGRAHHRQARQRGIFCHGP